MADIVTFPRYTNRASGVQSVASASVERRGQELLAALNAKEFFPSDDQMRAPANLHALIEDLCDETDVSKRAIVEASGMGGGGPEDSTKRLYEYTLPAEASESRKTKLAKKPGKYFRIAKAIAELSGRTENDVLSQIFEGCSYGSGHSFSAGENWDEIRWGKLTSMLQRMCASVISRSKVEEYWHIALMVTGEYHPDSGELKHASVPLDGLGLSFGLGGSFADPADIPPVPSILLAEVTLAEIPSGHFKDGDALNGLKLILEVRLAIAPARGGVPGPFLEYRLRPETATADGDCGDERPEVVLQGTEDNSRVIARIDDHDYEVELNRVNWLPTDLLAGQWEGAWYDWQWPDYYNVWDEINPAYLRDVFDEFDVRIQMVKTLDDDGYFNFPPSRFVPGSPGSYLHAELISEHLENKLLTACEQLHSQMLSFQQEITDRILAMEAEAEKRWLKDL